MDCCEYRCGAGGYAEAPYAPYAECYAAPGLAARVPPYPVYYDYRLPARDHILPFDYPYGVKDNRSRRVMREHMRRDGDHVIDRCARVPYCEPPQVWHHYQFQMGGTWAGYGRMAPAAPYRHDPLAGLAAMQGECGAHNAKTSSLSMLEHMHSPEVRPPSITPYAPYDDGNYSHVAPSPTLLQSAPSYRNIPQKPFAKLDNCSYRENYNAKPLPCKAKAKIERYVNPERAKRPKPSKEEIQPVQPSSVEPPPPAPVKEEKTESIPLPAFQQAFGSTEIGRFSEAFTRADNSESVITEDMVSDAISNQLMGDLFSDWGEQQDQVLQIDASFEALPCNDFNSQYSNGNNVQQNWSHINKEIKCENNC